MRTISHPGQFGQFTVPASSATELVLLPAYYTLDDLTPHFRDCHKEWLEMLLATSQNKKLPVLLWIRSGTILFAYDLRFEVAANLVVKRWDIRNGRQIRLSKEEQSSNGFLSVFFLD